MAEDEGGATEKKGGGDDDLPVAAALAAASASASAAGVVDEGNKRVEGEGGSGDEPQPQPPEEEDAGGAHPDVCAPTGDGEARGGKDDDGAAAGDNDGDGNDGGGDDDDDDGYGPHGVLKLTLRRTSASLPWRVALKTSPATGDVVAFPPPRSGGGFGGGDGGVGVVVVPLRDGDVISSIRIVDSVSPGGGGGGGTGPTTLSRPEVPSSVGGGAVTVVDVAIASAWLDLVAGAFRRSVAMELDVVRPPPPPPPPSPPPPPPPPEPEVEEEEEETEEDDDDEEAEEAKVTYAGGRRLATPKAKRKRKARSRRVGDSDEGEEGRDGEDEDAYVPSDDGGGGGGEGGKKKRKTRSSSAKRATTTPRSSRKSTPRGGGSAARKATPKKRTPNTPQPLTRRVHTLTLRRGSGSSASASASAKSKKEPWGVELKSAAATGDVVAFPRVPYPRGRGAPGKLREGDIVTSIRVLEGDHDGDGGGKGKKKGKGKSRRGKKDKRRGRPPPTTLTRPADIVLGDVVGEEVAEAWLDEVAGAFGRSTAMEVEVLRAVPRRGGAGATPEGEAAPATPPRRKSPARRLKELEEARRAVVPSSSPSSARRRSRSTPVTTPKTSSGRKRKSDQHGKGKGRGSGSPGEKRPRLKKVSWERRLEQLKTYRDEHGHCNVGKGGRGRGRTTEDGDEDGEDEVDLETISLGNWVSYQRWQYRRYLRSKVGGGDGGEENDDGNADDDAAGPSTSPGGSSSRSPRRSSSTGITMTEERIDALERIGFEWQTPAEFCSRARRVEWEDRLVELRRYQAEHGNCNVPQGHPTGLGKWVHNQRSNYKVMQRASEEDGDDDDEEGGDGNYTTMTPERAAALEEIGFQWRQVVRTDWNQRYRELLDYRDVYGNVDVPSRYPPNPSLASWVMMQRRMRGQLMAGEKPETSGMTHERAARLEEIGFKWRLKPVRQSVGWKARLADLTRYKERFGDCNVPQKWEENVSLGKWVSKVRTQYKLRKEGKPTPLTAEMVEELDRLDFGSTVGKNRVDWRVRLAELVQYKRRFGNCDVPIKFKENRKLGKWVGYARQGYKLREEGKPTYLSDEAIEELNKLEFKWRGRNIKGQGKPKKKNEGAPASRSNEV